MTAERWSTAGPAFVEEVEGSTRPAAYYLAESRDGLYVPYVVRTPSDEGRFPFVFLAYGNGGGGIGWLRQWVHTRPYIMERLLAAGYACGWGRYRTEVDLGFNRGGPLMVDGRQGMEVMNRSPLEFEDELAILEHVGQHPQVDARQPWPHRRQPRRRDAVQAGLPVPGDPAGGRGQRAGES